MSPGILNIWRKKKIDKALRIGIHWELRTECHFLCVKDFMQLDYSNLQKNKPKKTQVVVSNSKSHNILTSRIVWNYASEYYINNTVAVCTSFLFHMNDTKQTPTKDDPKFFMSVLQLKHARIFLQSIGRWWWYKFTYREFNNCLKMQGHALIFIN